MNPIERYLLKRAKQDNDAPQRSATGESEGLSFQHRDDDYAKGEAAWAATSKYFKGGSKLKEEPNPFKGKHHGSTEKQAVEVESAGGLSGLASGTLGRLFGAHNALISPRMLANADPNEVAQFARQMEQADPEGMRGLRIEVGGVNPWTRLKRTWRNPQTSVMGKLMGTLGTGMNSVLSPLTRSDHYDPYSNTISVYGKPKSIWSHEMGHAMDFNRRQGVGRDLYGTAYAVSPFTKPYHEAQANIRSGEALKKVLPEGEQQDLLRERSHLLSPAYGTYLGGAAAGAGRMALIHQAKSQAGLLNRPAEAAKGLIPQLGRAAATANSFINPKISRGLMASLPSDIAQKLSRRNLALTLGSTAAGLLGGHLYGRMTAPPASSALTASSAPAAPAPLKQAEDEKQAFFTSPDSGATRSSAMNVTPTGSAQRQRDPNSVIQRLLAQRRRQTQHQTHDINQDVTMMDKTGASPPMMPSRLISRLVPINARREDTEMQPQELENIAHGQSQTIPALFQTDATPIHELMASPGKQGLMAAGLGGATGAGLGYGAGKLAEKFLGTGPNSGVAGAAVGGLGLAALAGLKRLKGQRRRNEHLEEIMRRLPPGATRHDYVNTEMLWEALMNRFGGEKISMDKEALGAGTIVGGLYGAANAPEGNLLQNTAHGVARGFGADLGVGVGGGLGLSTGLGIGSALEHRYPGWAQRHPGMAALLLGGGALAGGIGGGVLGWKGAGKLLGESPAEKDKKGTLRRRIDIGGSGKLATALDNYLVKTADGYGTTSSGGVRPNFSTYGMGSTVRRPDAATQRNNVMQQQADRVKTMPPRQGVRPLTPDQARMRLPGALGSPENAQMRSLARQNRETGYMMDNMRKAIGQAYGKPVGPPAGAVPPTPPSPNATGYQSGKGMVPLAQRQAPVPTRYGGKGVGMVPNYDTSGFTDNARSHFEARTPEEQAKAWSMAMSNRSNPAIWAQPGAATAQAAGPAPMPAPMPEPMPAAEGAPQQAGAPAPMPAPGQQAMAGMEGPNKLAADIGHYAAAFLLRCQHLGMNPVQIKQAIDQVDARFGKQASDELYEGLEKVAGWGDAWKGFKSFVGGAPKLFRGAAQAEKAVAPTLAKAEQAIAPGAQQPGMFRRGYNYLFNERNLGPAEQFNPMMQGAKVAPAGSRATFARNDWTGLNMPGEMIAPSRAASAWNTVQPYADKAWQYGARPLAYGVLGAGAGNDVMGGTGEDPSTFGRLTGFGLGLASGFGRNNFLRNSRAWAPMKGSVLGGWGGGAVDELAGTMGIDTGGAGARWGARAGLASPLISKLPGMGGFNKNLGQFQQGTFASSPIFGAGEYGNVLRGGWKDMSTARKIGFGVGAGTLGLSAGKGAAGMIGDAIKGKAQQGMVELAQSPEFKGYMKEQGNNMIKDYLAQYNLTPESLGQMLQQGKGMMGMGNVLSGISGLADNILGAFGMDTQNMNPMMKIAILLGGGALIGGGLGGMMGGGSGAAMGGLGTLGGLALMGGLMGGRGNAPGTPAAAPGGPGAAAVSPGMVWDPSTGQMRPMPQQVLTRAAPERNELAVQQQQAQQAPPARWMQAGVQ